MEELAPLEGRKLGGEQKKERWSAMMVPDVRIRMAVDPGVADLSGEVN